METVRVWTATWDHLDVQGLCRTAPPLTGCGVLESWTHLSPTGYSTLEVGPAPHLDNTAELVVRGGEAQVTRPQV